MEEPEQRAQALRGPLQDQLGVAGGGHHGDVLQRSDSRYVDEADAGEVELDADDGKVSEQPLHVLDQRWTRGHVQLPVYLDPDAGRAVEPGVEGKDPHIELYVARQAPAHLLHPFATPTPRRHGAEVGDGCSS